MTTTPVSPTAYDPSAVYVRGEEWGISYEVSYHPTVVTLGVYKRLPLPNKWGGIGVGVHHPDHDGRTFTTTEEAQAYALAAGLIHLYVPKVAR